MSVETLSGERAECCAAPSSGSERLLVAGLGSVGKRHLDNLRALGENRVALYRTGRGTLVEGDPEGVPIHRDVDSALARRPRAVIVANPTALHVPLALAAARAGAHLLIEKPLSDSLDGVDELRREVEARALKVLVGFQFRFHPSLRRIKEWLEDRAVGRVVSVHARWGECLRGWHPWEDYKGSYSARRNLGGGVVLTLCHPFDYLRWLVGEIVTVSAETAQLGGLGIEVEDTAQILLRFENGAVGGVELDYVERPPVHTLRILGQRGRILWDNATGLARLQDREGALVSAFAPPRGFERNTLFLEEMRHFLQCLAGASEPECTVDDGIRALNIALAVSEAAAAGRRVHV
jgi:predicted dehydrogenase